MVDVYRDHHRPWTEFDRSQWLWITHCSCGEWISDPKAIERPSGKSEREWLRMHRLNSLKQHAEHRSSERKAGSHASPVAV